jgi:chemotaxis protein CheD
MYKTGDLTILQIGDVVVQKAPNRLKTELGSCVAVIIYHEKLKIGGMTHIMLPKSKETKDTRFADSAIEELIAKLKSYNVKLSEAKCYVYGGARVLQNQIPINFMNLAQVNRELEKHKLNIVEVDIGGETNRSIELDLNTGKISIKRLEKINTDKFVQ